MSSMLTIVCTDRTGPSPEDAGTVDAVPVTVDFSHLREHHRRMGTKHLENVDEFLAYWHGEAEQRFADPRARVVLMDAPTGRETFGQDLQREEGKDSLIAMAVWTVGSRLEEESAEMASRNGERIRGLLLDVTGTLMLFAIHDALLDWLRKGVAEPRGLSLTEEFYPGFSGIDSHMMERIQSVGKTGETIGVTARKGYVLHPGKSQCSFVTVGEGEEGIQKGPPPCNPCLGVRCLYYQLGGCHLTARGRSPRNETSHTDRASTTTKKGGTTR
ncbi:MAG: hypothetical protein K9L28_04285 [Synergistales bacterium]|nr:hypothetical protein [Synergistales bacterium]